MEKLSRRVTLAALSLMLAAPVLMHADVIRVQMEPNAAFSGRTPLQFTGVESSAAAADAVFGSDGSNTWNYLTIDPAGATTTNPSFSDLVDSEGSATGVDVSFTGTITSANGTPVDNNDSDALENDYFLITGTQTADYVISGLTPDTQYAFYLYSPNFVHSDSADPTDQPNRGYQVTANGDIISVPSGTGTGNNDLAFVESDSNGDISSVWSTPDGNEGDWSGFQLAPVVTPEPATLWLFGSALAALFLIGFRSRKRSNSDCAAATQTR